MRNLILQGFSRIEVSVKYLNKYMGIRSPIIRLNVFYKTNNPPRLTPTGIVVKTFTHVIGVVDLIFHPFHKLPKPLFNKGSLYKWIGHTHIASRGLKSVEEVMSDAKEKKTTLNLSRAEELVKVGQTRKILLKMFFLLLKGWNISNTTLKAEVSKDVSDQVEEYWLTMTAIGGMERWLKNFLHQVKFFILHKGKKTYIPGQKILNEFIMEDNLTFCLPNGISVPAFTDQYNWSAKKELDSKCCVCYENREDWKNRKVCWRSMKCAHVMCCTCHEFLEEKKNETFNDAIGGSIVLRKNYAKSCPVCNHPISKMAF